MKSNQTKSVHIGASVEQLLELMQKFPQVRDEADLSLGRKAVKVSIDSVYIEKLLDKSSFYRLKGSVLREAIDDLASGAPLLMKSFLGIKLERGQLVRAEEPYTSDLPMIYKVELKDAAAFREYTDKSEFELHEKTANAAIYYLLDRLSAVNANSGTSSRRV